MREAVILSAVRLPTGKRHGALRAFSAPELGALVIGEAVRRAGIDAADVDEVILGNVISAGLGQAPARQAAIRAGLPPRTAALTLNQGCGSGLKAVMLAAQGIAAGDADVLVAGGMESMSNCPRFLRASRTGASDGEVLDSAIHDGLWDPRAESHVGGTAELVAEKYAITREEQDRHALESHRKAVAAIQVGKFRDEILPVRIPRPNGDTVTCEIDEPPRPDTTLEALARLKPAFQEGGTVTAGNASGLNDGAAALVVASAEAARRLARKPIARIVAQAVSGIEPKWVLMAPVQAVRTLFLRTGWSAGSVDLVELNETFSVQVIAVCRELGLDPTKVNVHGGAVALGHPLGASGARILTTLLHALRDRGKTFGVAALSLGGGNAVALAVEMI